tara:strand:- start:8517 stop:9095 length:579 start_codon:yes stop_codon:yes gene_type:complete
MSNDSEESDDPTEMNTIEIINNCVYFYNTVTVKSILELSKVLRILETKLINLQINYSLDNKIPIYLHIQSNGGDAYAGLSGMNTIENLRVPVITIVDGFVASAATFLLFGGSERWMQKNSCVLIHQIRTEFWGRFEELKDDVKNSSSLMDEISRIYSEKSSIPIKKLKGIMKRELNLNTETCSRYNIVHKII